MKFRGTQVSFYFVFALILQLANARRNLRATSLVTCMENSQASANSFDVVFDPDDRSLHYTLDMVTTLNTYIYADVDVYAYGFKIITKSLDMCDIGWKQFCPVHPGNIEIDSIQYISKEYVDMIPGIAYQVPDIDAYVRLNVRDNMSTPLACLEIFFSNGKSVSQTGVKWATAVVAGIGLLLSAVLSTFGNSTAASHISANTMSLFLYFQSVAVISMQHVHYVPPIAAAWSENMAWSMGLIKIHFMQRIFRWYVEATGGTPTLYLTATTMSVLTQRSLDYLDSFELTKRAKNVLYGNQNTLIFRGIKRLAYNMGVENSSVVCTGFTFFVLCGYVLAGFIIICKYAFELSAKNGWVKPNRFREFRENWKIILKGSLLRYVYIGFTQLTILSFWEFTEVDSGAVVVIACLFLILSVGLMIWAAYRTCFFAKKSIESYNNAAALLYGDERILHKYGFFYTMFNAKHYWWNLVLLSYMFFKALFIGFAQGSGKTQAFVTWIVDMLYMGAVIHYQPYLDRPTNLVNICMCTVTTINSFLFLFFSDLFGQPYQVSAIMAWVYFIMNAAFSFLLLLMILTFTGLALFSKNPDLRFRPAKDDRTSFQKHHATTDSDIPSSVAQELLALGNVAKDHEENWEKHVNSSSPSENIFLGSDEEDEKIEYNASNNGSSAQLGRKPTLSERILGKLSGRHPTLKDSTDKVGDITNMTYESSESSHRSNSARKPYPNVEGGRPDSAINNGLIDSYEAEDSFGLDKPATNPFESNRNSALTDSSAIQRDLSMGSLGQNQDPTRSTDILKTNYF
ncbi:flavin adenine dinucleotide transporter KNAG_0D00970 [Huiozyma naganishii CBS 8797]|uniref:ML-like domain-containing protein n=1 Tax=Huiozyma naganishii (strain ATCC MYA-139 / BCRC 22969 / CBS 8797 / KCTC 17520 / NBRC 10181 / NCYC 3082 / Yp74L-3) TaxID=1071383 RepID=J7S5H6_HUIN7|nr:hypothetical protein KNAG_0D00970 [Kazachstania naganishii CBS 8797]CCK69849.1 hypothetical protein KNAG_0D00970 [Kazachstania naganishii CBS 8797]